MIVRADVESRIKGDGLKTTSKQLRTIEARQKRVRKGFSNITGSLMRMAAAAGGVYGAIRLVTSSLEAAAKQKDAINSLNLAIENQGVVTAAGSARLQEYAISLQKVSTMGDEVIISAQAIFAQFGMNEEQIKKSTKVALDFAAATGRNMKDAANAVGKAFAGQTDILREMGIAVDKTKSISGQFEDALFKLEKRFGGSALEATKTYTGQVAQLSNEWGDLMEVLGQTLADDEGGLGALSSLSTIIKELKDSIIDLKEESSGGFFGELGDFWDKASGGKFGLQAQAVAKAIEFGSPVGAAVGVFGALSSTTERRQAQRAERNELANLHRQFTMPSAPSGPGPGPGDTAAAIAAATKARKAELALIEKFRKEIAAGSVQRNFDDASAALIDTAHAAGVAGQALDDGIIRPAEEMVTALPVVKKEAIDWSGALDDLANQMIVLSQITDGAIGSFARFAAGIASGIAGIMSSLDTFKAGQKQGGFGGLLGQITGIGGIVTGALGIFGGIKSLFGGKSREEKAAEESERLAKELEEAERRAKGLTTAIGGLNAILDNLTFTDTEGNILNTFDNPQMGANAAQLFSSTFWATWREQGIAGIEKLRPMWDNMHAHLVDLGLDPTALGLGRIGDLMSQTADPRAQALLGVSRGAGQMVQGMMDAGFMSQADLEAASGMSQAALEELVAQGLDETTAAQAMGGDLAALAKAYEVQGQAMPQWLADALSTAGIEVLPTQLKVLEQIRDILKGTPSFARGGRGDFGGGTLARLHGAEVIVPERDIPPVGSGGLGVEFDAAGTPHQVRPRRRFKAPEQVVQITQQPVFNIDPLQTKQGREDLGRTLIEEWNRAARTNPTVRHWIRDAAGT